MKVNKRRRIGSFICGGAIAAIAVVYGCINTEHLVPAIVVAILGFTLSSCLILKNNFIPDIVFNIISWSFVQMPGLIFTLDLDGIIWLLTVKLLFWILGLVLAILLTILSVVVGGVVSLFVYPYAIVKNFRGGDYEEYDI